MLSRLASGSQVHPEGSSTPDADRFAGGSAIKPFLLVTYKHYFP
jgi:hypothetical protein